MSEQTPPDRGTTEPGWSVERVADTVLAAELGRQEMGRITDRWPDLDLPTAYAAQRLLIERKVAAGEHVIGVKLGLTSRAKQQRMGISSPLTAVLTDRMLLPAGEPLRSDELIHPRIEPEIVFVLGDRLQGPGMTAARVLAAIDTVHAGAEVIDSRYANFSFALPDVVADNASSARFAVGADGVSAVGLDLWLEACLLRRNGQVVDTATGAAIQGHPLDALAIAVNDLAERGEAIEAGSIVLTGGMTDAIPVRPGDDVRVDFTSLGSVTIRVEGTP